jgi:hypothetical protein
MLFIYPPSQSSITWEHLIQKENRKFLVISRNIPRDHACTKASKPLHYRSGVSKLFDVRAKYNFV